MIFQKKNIYIKRQDWMEEKRKDEQTKILKERRNERKKERQAHKNGKKEKGFK